MQFHTCAPQGTNQPFFFCMEVQASFCIVICEQFAKFIRLAPPPQAASADYELPT